MSCISRSGLFTVATLLLATLTLNVQALHAQHAQPASPPKPAKYQTMLRYRITAARDQHIMLYDALIDHLKSLGFEFDPPLAKRPRTDREDPTKNMIKGTVSAANAGKILDNFNVASLLLIPDGFRLPEDPKQLVRLRIELTNGLPPDRQRELSEQTRVLLRDIGFFEAVGYDHHGKSGQSFTRLVGAISVGRLDA